MACEGDRMEETLVTIVAAVLTLAIGVAALALLGVVDGQTSTSQAIRSSCAPTAPMSSSSPARRSSTTSTPTTCSNDPTLDHADTDGVFKANARCNDALRCRISVKVTVPSGAKVTVEAGSGELDTSGLTGSLRTLSRR
jgi:hypothetical protein